MNKDEDKAVLLWFKMLTFDIQDIVKKNNNMLDYLNLHSTKKLVYAIPDGELTKEYVLESLQINFYKTFDNDIRKYLRNIQLEYLVG